MDTVNNYRHYAQFLLHFYGIKRAAMETKLLETKTVFAILKRGKSAMQVEITTL